MSAKILPPKCLPSQLPSGAWVLRVVIDGCRVRLPLAAAGATEVEVATAHRRTLARWADVLSAFRQGRAEQKELEQKADGPTFGQVAHQWTSGELARRYPDHVKPKRSAADDAQRVGRYAASIADVPIAEFSLDHAERVMAELPEHLAPATRRQVAQVLAKVLHLSVYPLRLRPENPIPRGWLPAVRRGSQRQQETPYPSEIDRFVGCSEVPTVVRIFVGFLAREGMRHEEAEGLSWADVDLENGLVHLPKNKTDDPRSWDLRADTLAALRRWHLRCGAPRSGLVFVTDDGAKLALRADGYRALLSLAGVDRLELHEGGPATKPTGIHALRSLFVTEALAQGRSETWVTDRTGHRSRSMVDTYRRQGRAWAKLAPLGALDVLLASTDHGHARGHDALGTLPKSSSARRVVRRVPLRFWGLGDLVGHEGLEPSANGLRVPPEARRRGATQRKSALADADSARETLNMATGVATGSTPSEATPAARSETLHELRALAIGVRLLEPFFDLLDEGSGS